MSQAGKVISIPAHLVQAVQYSILEYRVEQAIRQIENTSQLERHVIRVPPSLVGWVEAEIRRAGAAA